ncbi:hypothetical protein HO133_009555 [Letharia lupina]|uniref:PABS domain-containing protein n=1 Tax=Letharia lupina TaxID=560253 RepID=A0A8H6CKY5_9LECA|nr:uncharacterized protein HO133_009555 [Letharia lupina]KAF6225555.1 hypothetical protein HO133_009555 [Letharia lupina]
MPPRGQRANARAPPLTQNNNAQTRTLWPYVRLLLTTLATLFLAAVSAEVSKLSLTPVYGSIPPIASLDWLRGGLEHDQRYIAMIISVSLAKMFFSKRTVGLSKHFAIWGFFVPSMQSGLYSVSGRFGPIWGPRTTYLLTSVPLSCLSLLHLVNLIAEAFPLAIFVEGAATRSLIEFCSSGLGTLLLTGTLYHFLARIKTYLENRLPLLMTLTSGTHAIFSRFGLQTVMALLYTQLGASLERFKLVLTAILPLLHLAFVCPHLPLPYNTDVLNSTLRAEGYSLVARQESLTGYISVLDNINAGYRVMRCDHSLLGGEYLNRPRGSKYNEPVYTIFLTLEAVRLLQTKSSGSQQVATSKQRHALVIGVGIGTAPAALIAHGVHTTTVEIDRVVHDFATKYFDLPRNHTSVIGDATKVVGDMQKAKEMRNTYDYIIHDVFTGGAEPINLFTREFIMGLSDLLRPDGIIAINYAGDLLLPIATSVVRTVESIFPKCRLYRESPLPKAPEAMDYTNMVMFCRKSPEAFTFRDPVEADFLGSPARRQHLKPQHEIPASYFKAGRRQKGEILRRDHISREMQKSTMASAAGHWYLMRTVLPDVVWENW